MAARVDASDIVQEALVVVAQRIDDFIQRRPASLRIWMRGMVLQQLIDHRRRHVTAKMRSVAREVELTDVSSMAIARNLLTSTPSTFLRRAELQARVRNLIAQLCEKDREILALRHAEGLSTTEVADLLDVDPSTARKRHGRALRRLRQLFAENNISLSGT